MAGIVLQLKILGIRHDLINAHHIGIDRPIEHVLERHDLAAIGLATRRLRRRISISEVFRNHPKPLALSPHPGGGNLHCIFKIHGLSPSSLA